MIAMCDYCGDNKKIFVTYRWGKRKCEDCYKEKKMSRKKRGGKRVKPEGKKLAVLRNILDKKFSHYIRLLYMKDNSKVNCFTCDAEMYMNVAQCGHYSSRKDSCVRWMIDNAKPQCNHCNVDLGGNLEVYKRRLEYLNPGITEIIEQMATQVCQYTRGDLQAMIDDINQKVEELKKG